MKKIQEIKEASLSLPDVRYGIDKQLRLIYAGTALIECAPQTFDFNRGSRRAPINLYVTMKI